MLCTAGLLAAEVEVVCWFDLEGAGNESKSKSPKSLFLTCGLVLPTKLPN